MGVKFFGQFLLERQVVTRDQLLEAIRLQDENNRTLGEIAVEKGYLSRGDANMINREQRITDKRFGDLAQETGLMTAEQVDEVARDQWRKRLKVGEALIKLGHINEDRLGAELEAFQHDQSEFKVEAVALPEDSHEPAFLECCIDLTEKLLLRVGGLRTKRSMAEATEDSSIDGGLNTVAIEFSEGVSAWYALSTSADVAHAVAKRILGDEFEINDEVAADALAEFCNIVCGNVCAKLSQSGKSLEIGPPHPGWSPSVVASCVKVVFHLPDGRCELRLQQ